MKRLDERGAVSGAWSQPTLGAALAEVAASVSLRDTAVQFPDADARARQTTPAELDEASARFARALLEEGVRPGDIVGVLMSLGPDLLKVLFGIMRAGAAATVLPVAQAPQLRRFAEAAEMRTLVTDNAHRGVADQVRELVPALRLVHSGMDLPAERALPQVSADDLAVVQFTSGSTMAPRGVMLTHRNILAGLAAIAVSAQMTPRDVWVQWAPHYHDLGLFGMLTNILNGGRTHAVTPRTFVRRPEKFLSLVSAVGGTLTTGPNFSYDLMVDAARAGRMPDGMDLSSWRLTFNGGEPISVRTVERFTKTFAPAGMAPSVMYPVYGMAEATLAIAFPPPGALPVTAWIDRDLLGTRGQARRVSRGDAGATGLVRVGTAVEGLRLRIVADGAVCGEGRLGEIELRGTAVTPGYYRNEHATAEVFHEGWLRSGDLGFWLDGGLYVAGRRKEMIIAHGRNYFPTDVEHFAHEVPGIYHGHVVAFADIGPDGNDRIGLVAETDLPAAERAVLAKRLRGHVAAELGAAPLQVHLVPPHYLTRSTSGKWQRLAAARRIATDGPPQDWEA